MSPDKSYEDSSDSELYHYDQPIVIAFYVKDIVLVADIVCCREIIAYFRQIMPLRLLSNVVPSLQLNSLISISG